MRAEHTQRMDIIHSTRITLNSTRKTIWTQGQMDIIQLESL